VAGAALGTGVAFAALGYLYGEALPLTALACGLVAVGTAAALRSAWSNLPDFVTGWLDAGLVLTVALLAVLATASPRGVAFIVLRGTPLAALSAITALAGTATASLGYTHRRLAREVAAQADRMAALQQRALESRLSALSAQVNPHFLFNTLNTLAELVHEDEDRAEDLITDLSGMMRHALRSSATRVPLSEELDIVRRMLRLEGARLGSRLTWSVDADPDVLAALIPGLLVQPLVENAVRHSIAGRADGGSVRVTAHRVEDRVQVVVADDGPGLPPAAVAVLDASGPSSAGTAGAGGGLWNCAERVRLAWPNAAATLTHDAAAPGTRLVLTFPLEGS
jgi:sensor histidine kinase YesM